jgi:hypothetical protein
MEKLFLAGGDPYAAARVLDPLVLPEFVRHGARTHMELAASSVADDFDISPPAISAWMEAARRRGVIARGTDTLDAEGRTLPEVEWNITPAGVNAHQRARWQAGVTVAWKVLRVMVPLAAAAFTLARILIGEDAFPDTGLLDKVQLGEVWDWQTIGPALAGAIGGAAGVLITLPILLAGRRRYFVVNASRVLAEQRAPLVAPAAGDVAPVAEDETRAREPILR